MSSFLQESGQQQQPPRADLVLSLTGFARKKWQAECAADNPS